MDIHPVDVAQLQKGDVISVERVESITGTRRDTQEFDFALMSLRDFIERESAKVGDPLLCRTRNGDLIVMHDAEAVHYTRSQFCCGEQKMYRNMARMMAVDPSKLSENELKTYDTNMRNCGAKIASLSAMTSGKRTISIRRDGNRLLVDSAGTNDEDTSVR